MITSSDSLKAKLKNIARETNISREALRKMVMFERLLMRISKSKYNKNFILKGGFLIAAIFDINLRSTVDIDTTIKGMQLNKESLKDMIEDIINISIEDNCSFEIANIEEIRLEDEYSGYNVMLKVKMDKIWDYISIDVATGDTITYKEINFVYTTILEKEKIEVLSYNNETIIAEKFEAIISRGIINTRMKDYYDLYMFVNFKFSEIDFMSKLNTIKQEIEQLGPAEFQKSYQQEAVPD
ncbi:MAG: nucleotidyl transferase AbiEii/AbiGii toxin family protein [Bacilli bacterium]|nr:nucleotidyl transferase AbiEii/AbiGii toxin family protein [Bacilli bacterium]MDD4734334.1 nucleotidyl transferase AbiEii/AbiGii toxin family protein [Bacilli bacterium]